MLGLPCLCLNGAGGRLLVGFLAIGPWLSAAWYVAVAYVLGEYDG